jgi:hypothetical protein
MKKSDYSFLLAAFVSFIFSISLWFGALSSDVELNKQSGIFVGLWVPSILALGLYFKLSKQGAA